MPELIIFAVTFFSSKYLSNVATNSPTFSSFNPHVILCTFCSSSGRKWADSSPHNSMAFAHPALTIASSHPTSNVLVHSSSSIHISSFFSSPREYTFVPTAQINISGFTITFPFSLSNARNDSNDRPVLYTSLLLLFSSLLMLLSSSSQNVRNSSVDWSSPTIVPSKSDTTKIGWFLLRNVSVVVVAN